MGMPEYWNGGQNMIWKEPNPAKGKEHYGYTGGME
jgi:hypothetical protein